MIEFDKVYIFDLEKYCREIGGTDSISTGSLDYFWKEHKDRDLRIVAHRLDSNEASFNWVVPHSGTHHSLNFHECISTMENYIITEPKYLDLELLI